TSYLVIDEFLDNFEELRQAGMRLSYADPDKATNFPGRNSDRAIQIDQLTDVVAGLVGERLRPSVGNAHGKFRITRAGDTGLADVHVDNCYWSGILYMRGHDDPEHGTHFFQHKETGTDRAPIRPEELKTFRAENNPNALKELMTRDGTNRDAWVRTGTVPARENRLLLLRPWLWHTAGPGFGQSIEDGRFIYLLFFDRV
ncbi:MAG: DUF6445 family protein, partial [Parvularcula sp.]|nr:DUF6445 family protein [Parvularcula sp.]